MSNIPEHKQGCDALGGYGHGVGPCTCGAAAPAVQAIPQGWKPTSEQMMAGYEVSCRFGVLEARAFELAEQMFKAMLSASPALSVKQDEREKDAERLDWLDATNKRFRIGWKVGMAPAGNVSVQAVIQLGAGPLTTIREAIDAARKEAGHA